MHVIVEIEKHLDDNSVLIENQSGYLSKQLRESTLYLVVSEWKNYCMKSK